MRATRSSSGSRRTPFTAIVALVALVGAIAIGGFAVVSGNNGLALLQLATPTVANSDAPAAVVADLLWSVVNPTITTAVGGTTVLTVRMESGSQQVTGFAAHINFDPAIVSVSLPTVDPDRWTNQLTRNRDNTLGRINMAYGYLADPADPDALPNPQGSVPLFTMTFTSKACGTTPLTFVFDGSVSPTRVTDLSFEGASTLRTANNNTIVVSDPACVAGTATATATTIAASETPTATLTPTIEPDVTPTATASATTEPTAGPSPTPTNTLLPGVAASTPRPAPTGTNVPAGFVQCDNLSARTNGNMTSAGGRGIVTAGALRLNNDRSKAAQVVGDAFCNPLVVGGVFVNTTGGIGDRNVIDRRPQNAVDIFGLLPNGAQGNNIFTRVMQVCFRSSFGSVLLFGDALGMPRVYFPLDTFTSGDYICAYIGRDGTIVQLPG